jgi:hypothetical protein
MKIIDNILPEEEFAILEHKVMGKFPWYFGRKGNGSEEDNLFLYSWFHIITGGLTWVEGEQGIFARTVYRILQLAGENVKDVFRVRMILNTATDKPYNAGAHVDRDGNHRTALLYINDSDGPTIIYNERESAITPTDFTVQAEVLPKRNRLLCFDGQQYHAGTTPTTVPRRVIMNINYSVE